jgi:protein tyrosine/serine phosphatase
MRIRYWLAGLGGGAVAVLAGLGAFLLALQLLGNFHEVVPGKVYRSAQLDAAQIDHYVQRYGIRSILNLRGAKAESAWYREETAAAARLGVRHVDFRISAARELADADIKRLRALYRDLPKPILVHCKAGADRSGLAAAIFLFDHGGDRATAAAQISIRYGHVGIPYLSETFAMDRTWARAEKLLDRKG